MTAGWDGRAIDAAKRRSGVGAILLGCFPPRYTSLSFDSRLSFDGIVPVSVFPSQPQFGQL